MRKIIGTIEQFDRITKTIKKRAEENAVEVVSSSDKKQSNNFQTTLH